MTWALALAVCLIAETKSDEAARVQRYFSDVLNAYVSQVEGENDRTEIRRLVDLAAESYPDLCTDSLLNDSLLLSNSPQVDNRTALILPWLHRCQPQVCQSYWIVDLHLLAINRPASDTAVRCSASVGGTPPATSVPWDTLLNTASVRLYIRRQHQSPDRGRIWSQTHVVEVRMSTTTVCQSIPLYFSAADTAIEYFHLIRYRRPLSKDDCFLVAYADGSATMGDRASDFDYVQGILRHGNVLVDGRDFISERLCVFGTWPTRPIRRRDANERAACAPFNQKTRLDLALRSLGSYDTRSTVKDTSRRVLVCPIFTDGVHDEVGDNTRKKPAVEAYKKLRDSLWAASAEAWSHGLHLVIVPVLICAGDGEDRANCKAWAESVWTPLMRYSAPTVFPEEENIWALLTQADPDVVDISAHFWQVWYGLFRPRLAIRGADMGIENLYLRCDPLPDGEAVDLEHSSLKGAVVPSLGSASVEISGFVSEICTHVGDTVLGRDSICLCLTQANVGVTYDAAESSAIRITGGTALVSWPGSAQAAGPVLLFVTDDDVTGKATALLPCKAETHSGKSWRLPSRLTGQTVVDFARLVAVAVQSSESASYCVHVLHRTFLWATPSIKFFLIAVWVSFVLYLLTSLPGLRGRGLYYAWVIGICCSVVFAAGMLLVITRGRFFAWLADSGVRTAVFLCGLAGVGLQVVGAAVGLRFGFPPANPQQTPDELWWVALPRLGVGTGSTLLFGVLPWNKSGWLPVVVVLAFVALITALSRPASTRSWLSELLLRLGVTLAFTLVVGPLFYALFVGPVPTAQLADYFAATWLRELGTGAVFAGAVASLAQAFRRR